MLRPLFVSAVFVYGLYYSLKSPFHALLLYLWVAHFRPLDWASSSWVSGIPMSMIAAVIVIAYTIVVHRRYSMNSLQSFMLLFCLLGGLSTWQSINVDYSWVWYRDFIKVVVITYALSILVTDLHKFRLAVLVICVSLGGEAARQALTGLVTNPGAMNANPILHLGDNNGVALGMVMLFCLVIGLYQSSEKRWERVLLGVLGAGVLLRAVSTYSRGAFVTLAVLMVLLWLQSGKKFRLTIAFCLLVAVVGALMPQSYYDRMGTLTEVMQEEGIREASASSRLHLWNVALQMANDHPITGVGFNAYAEAYGWYDFLNGEFGEHRAAHGSLPGVLADTGYVGALVYVLMLITAFHYMAQIKRKSFYLAAGKELKSYALALQNALVCFMVGGAFLSFMYYEIVWHLLGLCAALSLIAKRMAADHGRLAAQEIPVGRRDFSAGTEHVPGGSFV